MRYLLCVLLFASVSCNSISSDSDMGDLGTDMPAEDQAPGDQGADDLGQDDMRSDMADVDASQDMTAQEWSVFTHPCAGNRTDALWCDDTQTCWVGCGTTTTGTGLYVTFDGGETWDAPLTGPADYFSTTRVNSISRSSDGNLYVGGELMGGARVVSVAPQGAVSDVFVRGTTVSDSFTVGSFRRGQDGFAIAESLTGVELVQREQDGGDPTASWSTGRGFWDDGDEDDVANGVQILDLEVAGNDFWGVGSIINQPPTVFTPKWTTGDFDFGIVQLSDTFEGELWGVDVAADIVAVGGVNQDADTGVIYVLSAGKDASVVGDWTAFDVSTVLPDKSTWVTDVCVSGTGDIFATVRDSRLGLGFVLQSTDEGSSFVDITPYDAQGRSLFDDVSRCHVLEEGIAVAGAGGLFAHLF